MKAFFILAILSSLSIAAIAIDTTKVILYDSVSYQGNYILIDEDWHLSMSEFTGGIESIHVPAGWEIYAYNMASFTGEFLILNEDWAGGGEEDWMWSNRIESIRITRKEGLRVGTPATCIQIFADFRWTGEARAICDDWSVGGEEGFEWDEKISSIMIPPGTRIIAYEYPNFKGRSINLSGGFTVTRPDAIWNDRISSIRILPE